MHTKIGWMLTLGLVATGALASEIHAQVDPRGFLHGTVTMRSGDTYSGRIRWGREEAFWDDFFNSAKDELPAFDHLPRRARRDRRKDVEVFGYRFGVRWDGESRGRQFACRFGDIDKIEIKGDDAADVTMRNGQLYEVSGSSNDVGTEITVWDESVGEIALRWNRVDVVDFQPTPAGLPVEVTRLRGRVITTGGEFEGFIQWDSEECLSTDELNGDSDDGKLAIPMGRIAAIERVRDRCRVHLRDGREFELDGSNDVDSSIRGILVEDPRYGRVEVTWDAFERAEFTESRETGNGYDSYRPAARLRATVTDLDGDARTGLIYFDLDEAESWEFLNGISRGVEYNIPFAMVSSIEPRRRDSAEVTLRSGETLRLVDGQDVSDNNDGVLLFVNEEDDDPVYLRWEDVARIDFVQ